MLKFRVKILPSDAEADLDRVARSVESKLPPGMTLTGHAKEPIAFGLEALLLEIVGPDEEGVSDRLEEALRSAEAVGNVQILGVSRLSTTLK